jgi:hypothetical protein
VARILAGVVAFVLLVTGVFFIFKGSAEQAPALPAAPPAQSTLGPQAPLVAPEATPKSREEKRFSRADKDKDGRIQREELLGSRRKTFAKLDKNGNGALDFEEWAVRTVEKFEGADKDRTGWLSPAEYATTAPPSPKRKRCSC